VGAGLGGGSADAAAALRALNRVWNCGYSDERLAALGAGLGADVAMCIANRPVIARGIGELLTPLAKPLPECYAVLAHPREPLLTAAVYAAWVAGTAPGAPLSVIPADYEGFIAALQASANDLETAAVQLCPAIGDLRAALDSGADLVRMSGSGACCYALYRHARDAENAAQALRVAHPHWWIEDTRIA